jgi:hypothetical protein
LRGGILAKERDQTNEKVIWESYLKKCEQEGKEPSAKDFAVWAKTLLANL